MNSSLVGPRMKESVFKKVEIYWGDWSQLGQEIKKPSTGGGLGWECNVCMYTKKNPPFELQRGF